MECSNDRSQGGEPIVTFVGKSFKMKTSLVFSITHNPMQYLNRYVSITFEEHKMILIPIVDFFRENYVRSYFTSFYVTS